MLDACIWRYYVGYIIKAGRFVLIFLLYILWQYKSGCSSVFLGLYEETMISLFIAVISSYVRY